MGDREECFCLIAKTRNVGSTLVGGREPTFLVWIKVYRFLVTLLSQTLVESGYKVGRLLCFKVLRTVRIVNKTVWFKIVNKFLGASR